MIRVWLYVDGYKAAWADNIDDDVLLNLRWRNQWLRLETDRKHVILHFERDPITRPRDYSNVRGDQFPYERFVTSHRIVLPWPRGELRE